MDPLVFAVWNQIDAADNLLDLASFNTDQTMDKCSQQGPFQCIFSMQTFRTGELMILF